MKIELTEIKVEGWSLDVPSNFDDLYEIYEHTLQNDDWWHFFREGSYTLIRCHNTYVKMVCKLLETEHGIMPDQIHVTKPWVDNIWVTRKYQEEFLYMFHAFSVLAMKLLADEDAHSPDQIMERFIGVFDRVVHCFLNVARSQKKIESFIPFFPIKEESHVGGAWESMLVVHNALLRMYTLGNFSGKREIQEVLKGAKENGKETEKESGK